MTFLDLFAGIGGLRRGLELAGHKCIGFCEWDKYARASYVAMHCATKEQLDYLATLSLNKRQKEIAKDEYLNGEWCSTDIRTVDARSIPKADCWGFGAPCQDFSISGSRAGLGGDRSSLVREVFRVLASIEEEHRPEWLIYENVKGMLSSNRGFDFLSILLAMDELGYDCEWQVLNSKDFGVPQGRERVFTVGHLRRYGARKVFPLSSAYGTNSNQLKQVGRYTAAPRENPQRFRVYDVDGLAPCLNCMGGGGLEPYILCKGKDIMSGVDTVWSSKYQCDIAIRKLTPRECFRLQGWEDAYFDKARLVNSDNQLYKQAGNGITVNVAEAVGRQMV